MTAAHPRGRGLPAVFIRVTVILLACLLLTAAVAGCGTSRTGDASQTRESSQTGESPRTGESSRTGAPTNGDVQITQSGVPMGGDIGGAGIADPADGESGGAGHISIVCTAFPQYDWTRAILGDRAGEVGLSFLMANGVDLHSFQPSMDDIVKISSCDLFIYVGGESDAWVEDALNESANQDMAVINLLEVLGSGAVAEEVVEGMQEEEHAHSGEVGHEADGAHGHEDEAEHELEAEHEHGDEAEHVDEAEHMDEAEHVHGDGAVYDEHVWLSLKNAGVFCGTIADVLSELDAAHAELYNANCLAYREKLSELDSRYRAAVDAAPVKTLLFGDRFPFRYLTEDYGISYFAAFPGCSAETEASFETIVFLSDKLDELGLNAVVSLEGSDQAIADTIIGNAEQADCRVIEFDSLQSVSETDDGNGATYLSAMEHNLTALREALR